MKGFGSEVVKDLTEDDLKPPEDFETARKTEGANMSAFLLSYFAQIWSYVGIILDSESVNRKMENLAFGIDGFKVRVKDDFSGDFTTKMAGVFFRNFLEN